MQFLTSRTTIILVATAIAGLLGYRLSQHASDFSSLRSDVKHQLWTAFPYANTLVLFSDGECPSCERILSRTPSDLIQRGSVVAVLVPKHNNRASWLRCARLIQGAADTERPLASLLAATETLSTTSSISDKSRLLMSNSSRLAQVCNFRAVPTVIWIRTQDEIRLVVTERGLDYAVNELTTH